MECQHFLDCIRNRRTPLTSGRRGLELVKILEAASASLKRNGAAIEISESRSVTSPTDASKAQAAREPELVCA